MRNKIFMKFFRYINNLAQFCLKQVKKRKKHPDKKNEDLPKAHKLEGRIGRCVLIRNVTA